MSHEIYYTSAPEGVRHGQQGFCTVATSAGIPKPLWDRLESVSGYRHPFGSQPGRSPVAWAHWLIQAGGREVSVLSRICDSGMDYTQRTNSFAHHVALELEERAAAGPAWMLQREGLMVRQWDGRVGNISRAAALPRGDSPPTPCNGWKQMTGDAGWGGVLAETAVKNPRKPVCILFNPGVDLLPLIAESIALLPARLRWQVTFNTYFTSAPGTAMCAWRCCVANSPAAQETLRQSAGSLVLDLSNPARLGAPPAGPWVDAARAGRVGAAEVLAPAPAYLKPAVMRPAPSKADTVKPPPMSPMPPMPPMSTIPLAERPPAPAVAPRAGAPFGVVASTEAGEAAAPAELPWQGPRRTPRRMWILGLCAASIAFIGIGTWLRLSADRDGADRTTSSAPPTQAVVKPATPTNPNDNSSAPVWPFGTTQPADGGGETVVSVTPPTMPSVPVEPPPVQPEAPPVVQTPPPVVPLPPAPPPVQAPESPVRVELGESVKQPAVGAGISDSQQRILLPPRTIPNVRLVSAMQVEFPGRQVAYRLSGDDLAGELSIVSQPGRPIRQNLVWRDAGNPGAEVDVASVSLEQARQSAQIVIGWKSGTLLKRPAVSTLTRAVLQNAVVVITGGHNARAREISFKQPELIDIGIGEPHVTLSSPQVPPGITLQEGRGLAYGWKMSAERELESGAHAADSPGWALHFKGPNISANSPNEFEVHIASGWSSILSNWSAQRKSLAAAESVSAEELKRVSEEADQQRSYSATAMEPLLRDVQEATSQLGQSDDQLSAIFTSRAEVRKRLEAAKGALAQQRTKLDQASSSIMSRRMEADRNHSVLAAGLKALDDVNGVEIWAELPGGLRTVGFRLVR